MSMGWNNPPQMSEAQKASDQELVARLAEERTKEAYAWPFKTRRTTEETAG